MDGIEEGALLPPSAVWIARIVTDGVDATPTMPFATNAANDARALICRVRAAAISGGGRPRRGRVAHPVDRALVRSQWSKQHHERVKRRQLQQRVRQESSHVVEDDGRKAVGPCGDTTGWGSEDGGEGLEADKL